MQTKVEFLNPNLQLRGDKTRQVNPRQYDYFEKM